MVQKNLETGELKRIGEDKSTTFVVGAGGRDGYKPQFTQMIDEDGSPLYWDSNTASLRRVGTGEAAKNPSSKASASERKEQANINTLKDQVSRIRTMYKPEYVGVTSGRAGAVSQLWNADESGFRAIVSDLGDQLLRARSGAQINEQEYKRLMRIAPTATDSNAQFVAKLDQFERTLDSIISSKASLSRRSGVATTGSVPKKVGRFTVEVE